VEFWELTFPVQCDIITYIFDSCIFSAPQVQCRQGNCAGVKGNQVQVLDDPVTVSGEKGCGCHCANRHEKVQPAKEPQVRKPAENNRCISSGKAGCPRAETALFAVEVWLAVRLFPEGNRRFC